MRTWSVTGDVPGFSSHSAAAFLSAAITGLTGQIRTEPGCCARAEGDITMSAKSRSANER